MVSSLAPVKINMRSRPYWQRPGLWPMVAIVGLAWLFVIMWIVVCIWVFQYNPYWSIVLLGSTLAFSSFLGLMSYKMVNDSFREFFLEISETEAVLSVIDKMRHRRSVQMVLLDDITFAEYYPFQDSASVILHTSYADMEIPLWPMQRDGADVVDFLAGRGIKVVNVQSDDQFPPEQKKAA